MPETSAFGCLVKPQVKEAVGGRGERKRREAITVVPVWGSEGLASIVNQRWSRQMQERVMNRLGNLSEVTMDLK